MTSITKIVIPNFTLSLLGLKSSIKDSIKKIQANSKISIRLIAKGCASVIILRGI